MIKGRIPNVFMHVMMYRAWLLVFQLPLVAFGQGYTDQLVHHDIKGLPVAPITCLQKDRDGALWIGTENGLCRYDGVNVDVYRNIPGDSTSLPGDFVRDLVMDGGGMIWVSCFGGVGVFDPHLGGRSSQLRFDRKALLNASGRYTSIDAGDLFLDHQGGFWLTCARGGLAHYDAASGMFHDLKELHNTLPIGQKNPFTLGVTRDAEGMVWCTDAISVYSFDPENHRMKRFATSITPQDGRKGIQLARLIQDPQDPNTLWLGSRGAGLIHFDKRTGGSQNYTITNEGPVDLKNIVWAMLPRKNGHLLIAIDKELRDFDPRSRTFDKPFSTLEYGSGKFESIGNALMQDEDERIWVGTAVAGIFTLPPRSSEYRQWRHTTQLFCTASDHPGYWGAHEYANRKLFKLGPQGEALDSVRLPYSEQHRFEPISIMQTRNGHVMVGTTNGLFVYDPRTRSLAHESFANLEGAPNSPIGIHAMVECEDSSVWMAFNGKGILRYRPSDMHTELVIPQAGGSAPAIRRTYRTITAFGKDHLAVTYESGGVGIVDTRTMALADMLTYGRQGRQLANINALITRCDSVLFAVTNNEGIVELRYHGDSLRYAATYVDDEDRTNSFGDAAADALGNIWIATNTGLVLFRPADHSFQHIGLMDGLGMPSVASIIPDRDSCMLAWNSQCARFNANTFARPAQVSGLNIRSVDVHGAPKNNRGNAGAPAALTLPHDLNSITITYAPIALLHAEALRYEVMLEGRDARWVDNGHLLAVSYIGLEPGNYTFKVRVAGKQDAMITAEQTFRIVPAYWQTWWFKAGVAIAIAAMIFLLSRYVLQLRYRQRIAALEREREIGAVRTRIARDIHDDIGSGLTKITMLGREMKSTDDKEKLASHIASASSELIGQLGEIVWTVDPGNDSAENFIAHLRSMLGKQFEELSTTLRTDLAAVPGMERRDIPPDVKRNVVMILKETVSNALKHAQAAVIQVTLHVGARELSLDVKDDGHGFDTATGRAGGNGLGNLRKRAEAMGGKLVMESDATGTRCALRVPLPPPTFMREP